MKLGSTAIGKWGPVVVWMGFIFWLSAQPKAPLGWLVEEVENGDKVGHAALYLVLGALLWRALRYRYSRWKAVGVATAVAVVYGITDEVHQLFVPGRSFELLDLTADGFGAAVSAVLLAIRLGGHAGVEREGSREDL